MTKQVKRKDIEEPKSLTEAIEITEIFYYDQDTYPSKELRLRKGINKDIAEEYSGLVKLAQEHEEQHWSVRTVRLFPEFNQGPDAEIQFLAHPSSMIQITCANEIGERYLLRRELANNPQKVVSKMYTEHGADLEVKTRLERIIKAIEAKDKKFYHGTDTLLIIEDPDLNFLKDRGLHEKVCENVQKQNLGSKYERIYIIYGLRIRRVK